MTNLQPCTEAERLRPPLALLRASRTSLTVAALERSTVAEWPDASLMVILPRATPAPPLRSARLVSRSRRPAADSNVNVPAFRPPDESLANPRDRNCWVEIRA